MALQPTRDLPAPRRVDELPEIPLHLEEKIDGSSDAWAKIHKNEYAEAALDPCALIVIRAQGDAPLFVGHFYHADLLSRNFEEMLNTARTELADARGIRVDCLGVSDCIGRITDRDDISVQKTKDFILKKLAENGFTRVFTQWSSSSKVQDVLVNGENKQIHYREYEPY